MAEGSTDKLLRLIFQARYKPTLGYFGLADRAAAQFEADYPNWRRGDTGDIKLSDYRCRSLLSISHAAFSYIQDSSDRNLANTRLQRILKELPPALQLDRCARLGLRHFVLVPVDMKFESLVTVMMAKLYIDAKPLRNALPQKTDDLAYRLDGSEGDCKFHVLIAPVRREEIGSKIVDLANAGTIDPKGMHETIKKIEAAYPPVGAFFDVDVYREAERIEIGAAQSFADSAGQRIDRTVKETISYLMDKAMEPK